MKKSGFEKRSVAGMCLTLLFVAALSGCQESSTPRLRLGAYFGSPTKMEFPDPENLGRHNYASQKGEKLGMVYTCKGGFIDVGHVREAADRTVYLTGIARQNLMLKKTVFTYRVIEPSQYWVKVTYPPNWDKMSIADRERIARQASILLGQYFARTSLIWHEILTWYGFASTGIFSEHISSFSPEDAYSDFLGTCLAVRAMQTPAQEYDEAMTHLLDAALREMDVQPPKVARHAVKQIEGEWFSGGYYFFVDMKKRNFDVGLSNGQITPWLVPDVCPNVQPEVRAVPGLDFLTDYGLGMELKIESREMEKKRIYRDLQMKDLSERIRPSVHFPLILEHIKKQAQKSSGDSNKDVTG